MNSRMRIWKQEDQLENSRSYNMKDYVQVPAAEFEKPYELTSTRESTPFLWLSRSMISFYFVSCDVYKYSVPFFKVVNVTSFVIAVATVILMLYYLQHAI